MGRPKKQIDDLLTVASAEADRLGMSYGQFSAMCQNKYPKCHNPIARYFEDQFLAGRKVKGGGPSCST